MNPVSDFTRLAEPKPSRVYDTYWKFAAERQSIFFARVNNTKAPWTNDPILRTYKFTNTYRAADRVSQFLIKNVIYGGDKSPEEVVFRTLLFKFFNRIETWKLMETSFDEISYESFSPSRYDAVLSECLATGSRIYSAAYIMPPGTKLLGMSRKHQVHLQLLTDMMKDELPLRLIDCKAMSEMFELLLKYPLVGPFLAYQFSTDLNYGTLVDFSEMDFVKAGPGALDGISKCFESLGDYSSADTIRFMADRQDYEFERLGLNFQSLWGRPLQLIDCQNLFCEVSKYTRQSHPEISGKSGSRRIKQKFREPGGRINYWFPPKWGLNARVRKGVQRDGSE